MNIKKFIESVLYALKTDEFEKVGKKKSIKRLLKKLEARKKAINEIPRKNLSKKERKELSEEMEIISLHIKKGKKILEELSSKER